MKAAKTSSSRAVAPAAARRSDRRLIQSVDRSIELLDFLARSRHPLSVAELAAACEVNCSTAWRLLLMLEHHGLVERDGVSQRYALGYALVRMAAGKTDHAILIRTARPALERVAAATGETVNLSVATSAGMVVCIDQVDGVTLVGVNWLDRPLPWHCTSAGKLHLALLPPTEPEAYLAQGPFQGMTPQTITDPARLRVDLELTRQRGYSIVLDGRRAARRVGGRERASGCDDQRVGPVVPPARIGASPAGRRAGRDGSGSGVAARRADGLRPVFTTLVNLQHREYHRATSVRSVQQRQARGEARVSGSRDRRSDG